MLVGKGEMKKEVWQQDNQEKLFSSDVRERELRGGKKQG